MIQTINIDYILSTILLGLHCCWLQPLISLLNPEQNNKAWHVLVRSWVPAPHEAEHGPKELHSPHSLHKTQNKYLRPFSHYLLLTNFFFSLKMKLYKTK